MAIQIGKENEDLLYVSFNYAPDRIKKIKKIPGSYWVPKYKQWHIPYTRENLLKILQLFDDEEVCTDDALGNMLIMKSQYK
ncbi:hypothetical protein [Anaerosolibacter sp.]|uniref:hypothetical protein n=1 Tax=Anaerosolibacter sp. TaxID=1872527 RepID=UPI0039EF887B